MAVEIEVYHQTDGFVQLSDPASTPEQFSGDTAGDVDLINAYVDAAVEGRVVAWRFRRGDGCIEIVHDDGVSRAWSNVFVALPGWRRRAAKIDFDPYR